MTIFANPPAKVARDVDGKQLKIGDVFRLIGNTTEFRVDAVFPGAADILTVHGVTLDGKRQTTARVGDVKRLRAGSGESIVSRAVKEIWYVHSEDGRLYRHEFAAGVSAEMLPDGSARFYRPDGKPVLRDFP